MRLIFSNVTVKTRPSKLTPRPTFHWLPVTPQLMIEVLLNKVLHGRAPISSASSHTVLPLWSPCFSYTDLFTFTRMPPSLLPQAFEYAVYHLSRMFSPLPFTWLSPTHPSDGHSRPFNQSLLPWPPRLGFSASSSRCFWHWWFFKMYWFYLLSSSLLDHKFHEGRSCAWFFLPLFPYCLT